MITLDDFLGKSQISRENRKIEKGNKKKFVSQTRKEYRMEDLALEIRKDPKKFVEKIKNKNLTEDQKKLIELIEEGAKLKIQKGKKKDTMEILEPYSPYLLLQLQNSMRRRNL
ncbi:MAG: hypothetical protein ACP5L4_07110 [Thermoplasmata archaeon]